MHALRNSSPSNSRKWVRRMSNVPEVVPLFATPLVVFDIPDAATLNAELRRVVEERQKSHPSTHKSNMGGWQSSWDMDRWGGAPAIKLLAYSFGGWVGFGIGWAVYGCGYGAWGCG